MMQVRDHIYAEIINNLNGDYSDAPKAPLLLAINVDDYSPASDEKWDVDAWEERQGYIYAPASRGGWNASYRLARALSKGPVNVVDKGIRITLPSVVTINLEASHENPGFA